MKTKYPENPRKISIPTPLGWIVSLIGLACAVSVFFITFAQPAHLPSESYESYVTILTCAYLVIFAIPHILFSIAKSREGRWKAIVQEMFHKGHTTQGKSVVDEEHSKSRLKIKTS